MCSRALTPIPPIMTSSQKIAVSLLCPAHLPLCPDNVSRALCAQAFSGSGSRMLRGCYINIDDAMSRLRTLHVDRPPSDDPLQNQLKRQGNGSLGLVAY